MDLRDPRPSHRSRSLIDEAEGQIRLLPVGNVTGDERAHAQNKSSIFDVLNNEFDRAVKFFSNKTWLYAHLKVLLRSKFNVKFFTKMLSFQLIRSGCTCFGH